MKAYIAPSTIIFKLTAEQALLEGSITYDSTKTINTESNGSWAKQDATSSHYSVWDDDWSN